MAGVHSFSLRAFQNLCTLISAASKLAQLRCLWQTKDSGQVSALTWSMAAYTCASKLWMGSLVQSTEITFFEAIFAPNAVNRSLLKRVSCLMQFYIVLTAETQMPQSIKYY